MKRKPTTWYGKTWHFLWVDDSPLSWVVSIIVAFILIKFIFYPGLGLVLGTQYPVVAVVSGSMEHSGVPQNGFHTMCGERVPNGRHHAFDDWWEICGGWYEDNEYNIITKEEFQEFTMSNGFNKGDIIFLRGKAPEAIEVGDILIYHTSQPYPIIHRAVHTWVEDSTHFFTTKGDNNGDVIRRADYEERIHEDQLIGTAWFRIPYIGYIKIIATDWIFQPIANFFK